MRVIVIQSYKEEKPQWITSCMKSVEKWARKRDFNYRTVGDEIINNILPSLSDNVDFKIKSLLPSLDIARIGLMHKHLITGDDYVIWVDADVLIVEPDLFLPELKPILFNLEIWESALFGQGTYERINNAVCAFDNKEGLGFIRAYLPLMYAIAEKEISENKLDHLSLSTNILDKLQQIYPFDIIKNCPTLHPSATRAILNGQLEPFVNMTMAHIAPIAAIHFAHRLAEKNHIEAVVKQVCNIYKGTVDIT